MYETLIFTGGVHKSEEIRELIEDLGGFILQDSVQQMELVLNMAVPLEDVDKIEEKSKELLAKLSVAPMAGSEIAIVSPTLARHHLPHAACDISEYLTLPFLLWAALKTASRKRHSFMIILTYQ